LDILEPLTMMALTKIFWQVSHCDTMDVSQASQVRQLLPKLLRGRRCLKGQIAKCITSSGRSILIIKDTKNYARSIK